MLPFKKKNKRMVTRSPQDEGMVMHDLSNKQQHVFASPLVAN